MEGASGMTEPIVLCFSGGKDSVMALHELRRGGEFQVVELLATVTDAYDRVSMHGVRRTLLRAQAASLGLAVTEVVVPARSSNAIYEEAMGKAFAVFRERGIERVAFGDIFLEDLREYRERQLAASGLHGLFPLWNRPTPALARTFIDEAFRAVTVCVDASVLGESFVGRPFDARFLADLPASADPCGENGEFHTFVHDGPGFARPIHFSSGTTVRRDGFFFQDLLPRSPPAAS